MRRIDTLVIHHNGVPGRTIENIRRSHKARGFDDVGYHVVVEESGQIRKGRPLGRAGAHVTGLNAHSIGICLIGNGNQRDFNEAQYDALLELLVGYCDHFGLDETNIYGHRETGPLVPKGKATKKTCPGRKVNLDLIRDTVKGALEQRTVTVEIEDPDGEETGDD